MKFLILQDIPVNQSTEKFCIARGLERAFLRSGFNAIAENTRDMINIDNSKIKVLFNQFDILLITQNYFLDSINFVKDFKGLKIFWSIDSHKDFERHANFVLENKIDIVLVSTYSYINQFKQKGLNAFWFPNCYPADLIIPVSFKHRPIHVGFCGSLSNRTEWINKLRVDRNLHTAINVCGEDMLNEIYSYKIGWNRNESDDINFRTFETMGAGCLLITNLVPGMQNLFLSCIIYSSYEECIDLISFYSRNDNERMQIALNGYNQARKQHSYDSRVPELIKIIEIGEGTYQ